MISNMCMWSIVGLHLILIVVDVFVKYCLAAHFFEFEQVATLLLVFQLGVKVKTVSAGRTTSCSSLLVYLCFAFIFNSDINFRNMVRHKKWRNQLPWIYRLLFLAIMQMLLTSFHAFLKQPINSSNLFRTNKKWRKLG